MENDIKTILEELKRKLKDYKLHQDSYSDVIPTLERMVKEHMTRYEQHAIPQEYGDEYAEIFIKATEPEPEPTVSGVDDQQSKNLGDNKNNTIKSEGDKKQAPPNNVTSNNKSANGDKKSISKSSKVLSNKQTNNNNNNKDNCNATKTVKNDKIKSEEIKKSVPKMLPDKTRTQTKGPNKILSAIDTVKRSVTNSAQVRPKSSMWPTVDRNVYNPLAKYKDEVDAAIKAKKTFTVKGSFPAIRRALLRRGWIEKLGTTHRDLNTADLRTYASKAIVELLDLIRQNHPESNLCKRIIRSKLLINHQVDFYWGFNYHGFRECPDKNKLTLINKIRWYSPTYTSKQGMCISSQKAFWFNIPGVAGLNHPRSYRLVKDGDVEDFVKDFNLTAAMSLLKWVQITKETGQCRIISSSGKVPIKILDFAVNECYKFIKKSVHEDIDHEIKEAVSLEWNEFLEYFYKIVHIGNHFKEESCVTEKDLVRRATFVLEKLKEYWPFLNMDGVMNIWILKPANSCRGVGIHMCRTIKYVLDTLKNNPQRRYIIQKYIERPLLIYNTKFDIRQWFLISCANPLTIWIYRQCYVRFSSQTYSLRKLHESIHLTNNSIQCKYQNQTRDMNLPSFNMWDSVQFRNYLSDIGHPTVYNKIIFPGMKECITAAVLTHYENMDQRQNSFELYGADFILTEDFKPWLLEINSNPALYGSTPITARLCPRVLEDVIKVVVDFARNKESVTGGFEPLYKGTETKCQNTELKIAGKHMKIQDSEQNNIQGNEYNVVKVKSPQKKTGKVKDIGISMKKTLEDLLNLIQSERERRESLLDDETQTYTEEYVDEVTETEEIVSHDIGSFCEIIKI
ncbi:unnamed protein product [Diabrotica balteata]|uniref:Tubulin glycylase 3A n=1 Tax=Diabrotica balteata TaxID=107213 RepID=A0A9N9X689_DIABA|nr:unnamed protein product [Diabrotica balteata]